ncbi:uncharacterized protein LOC129923368 [Biomphalaria glabrata]|uniref:Uncharacterized protein LOC129923368 n=1 Tax=Biomphalaria glabrata TaxID=6526 RepID=A0A9W2Z4Q5_BIOGL|nr:uncharacterized protein LOC129923368 [Biomphalaria glabrata]
MILLTFFVTSSITVITGYSHLELKSKPGSIHPILTKKLQMECTVRELKSEDHQFQNGNSAFSNTEAIDDKSTSKASVTKQEVTLSRLLSLVITKKNEDSGLNETMVSVTGCDSPVIEKQFEGTFQADGTTEGSTKTGEMGYISLTWNRPVDEHSGLFFCEAYALDPFKHSVSLTAGLKIKSIEPKISDLVTYISINDRHIEQLQAKVSEIKTENTELKERNTNITLEYEDLKKYVDLRIPKFQFGSFTCSSQGVTFDPPFNKTPEVFTSLTGLTMGFSSQYSTSTYSLGVQSVDNLGFSISCTINGWSSSAQVKWLAVEL